MRTKLQPLRFASCLTMIVWDWTTYTGTMVLSGTWPHAWLLSTLIASAATFFAVALIESRAHGASRHSFYRGLTAALLVAAPLPVLGTAVGLGCMIWGASGKRSRARTT